MGQDRRGMLELIACQRAMAGAELRTWFMIEPQQLTRDISPAWPPSSATTQRPSSLSIAKYLAGSSRSSCVCQTCADPGSEVQSQYSQWLVLNRERQSGDSLQYHSYTFTS